MICLNLKLHVFKAQGKKTKSCFEFIEVYFETLRGLQKQKD